MEAGAYRYPIKIFHLQQTKQKNGEVTEEYVLKRNTRAAVNFRSNSRTINNDRIVYPGRYEMIVRSYCEINNNTQIEWQHRRFRVIDWHEDMEFNDIVLEIEEVEDATA